MFVRRTGLPYISDLLVADLKYPGAIDVESPLLANLDDRLADECRGSIAETIGVALTSEQLADLLLSMRDTDTLIADFLSDVTDNGTVRHGFAEMHLTDAFAEHMLLRREPVSDHEYDPAEVRTEIRSAASARGYELTPESASTESGARSWLFWAPSTGPDVEVG